LIYLFIFLTFSTSMFTSNPLFLDAVELSSLSL